VARAESADILETGNSRNKRDGLTRTDRNDQRGQGDQIAKTLPLLLAANCKTQGDCGYSLLYVEGDASFSVVTAVVATLAKNAATRGATSPTVQFCKEEPPPPGTSPLNHFLATRIRGRLPPEQIQKIVRTIYHRFRTCYEQGLSRNKSLAGKVVVRFVIGREGNVTRVLIAEGTSMPDRQVVECVAKNFYDLVFPQPEDGIVTVVYPLTLSPG